MEYFSQFGQDRFIDEVVMRGKTGGVFVEIGAYDGVTFSNTLFLERYRGWTGLCVEPNPMQWDALQRNRSARCRQVCIGDRDETIKFRMVQGPTGVGMLSGRTDAGGTKAEERIEREQGTVTIVDVPCITFERLMREEGISNADYISIDAEGHDFAILRAIDLARGPACITMEENHDYFAVRRYVQRFGYRIAEKLQADYIIVRGDVAGAMGGVGLLSRSNRLRRYGKTLLRRLRLQS
jgi:FkbM family methyltransferase